MTKTHPAGGTTVTSGFRTKKRPTHHGIDYSTKSPEHPTGIGYPIVAAEAGTVENVAKGNTEGLWVGIRHADGTKTFYLHLSERLVTVGQQVSSGQVIGKSGATGQGVTGAHLHFGVKGSSDWIDPAKWLKQATPATKPQQAAPQSAAPRNLVIGLSGEDVKQVQRILNAWYPNLKPGLLVDGIYGPKTERRVRYLQQRAGLLVDGIVGPKTRAVLGID